MVGSAVAQVRLTVDRESDVVFGGQEERVQIGFIHSDPEAIRVELGFRLWQSAASTAIPLGPSETFRILDLPPRVECRFQVPVTFPEPDDSAEFVVQWIVGERSLGASRVLVIPRDHLRRWAQRHRDRDLWIYDPAEELKPVLKEFDVPFLDLLTMSGPPAGRGLLILGPFEKSNRDEVVPEFVGIAETKAAAVARPAPRRQPENSGLPFIRVHSDRDRTLVEFPEDYFSDLEHSAKSQFRLTQLLELTWKP